MTGEQVIYVFARFLGVMPTPGEIIHHANNTSSSAKHDRYLQLDPRIFSEPKGKRKNLLIYTSCHAEQITHYMVNYRQDVLDECYLHCLFTHRMSENREASNNRLVWSMFNAADLIIWNVLGEKFAHQSTDVLGKHCKSDVKIASFVAPCFAAFWPVAEWFGEEGVVACLEAGMTDDEILSQFRSGKFDPKFEMRFGDQIERLAYRERERDVKLSEFIKRRHKNWKLFFTTNHPTFNTIAYLTDNSLGYLGFKELGEDHSLARDVNEAGFGGHYAETHYEFAHYGFTYPIRFPNDRGGMDACYSQMIRDASARWKARGGGLHYTDRSDDY